MHGDETEVARACAYPVKSRERKKAFEILKNKGNFLHNVEVLNHPEGNRKIIVVRRSGRSDAKYLPCPLCCGFFIQSELWRHYRVCPCRSESDKTMTSRGVRVQACLFLQAAILPVENSDRKDLEPILVSMHKDAIYKLVVNDRLILKFGKILYHKLGHRRKNDVSQRMRQLGRLKKALGTSELYEYINGKNFNQVVRAAKQICNLHTSEDGLAVFDKPGLALRLGHNLKKTCSIKYGMALREDDGVGQLEADTFSKLLGNEWTDSISSVALTTLATNKFTKRDLLPLTTDLVKLAEYLDKEGKERMRILQTEPSAEAWRDLAEVVLGKVVVFNKRRGGEVQNLLLTQYVNRKKAQTTMNQEVYESLTPLEKKLTERYGLALHVQ